MNEKNIADIIRRLEKTKKLSSLKLKTNSLNENSFSKLMICLGRKNISEINFSKINFTADQFWFFVKNNHYPRIVILNFNQQVLLRS